MSIQLNKMNKNMNQESFQDEYEYNEKDFQNNFQDLLDSEDEEEENLYEEENRFLHIVESINQETLERYAMYFMLTYTADEYKNDETLNNIKNELVNIVLNKEFLKIKTRFYFFRTAAFFKDFNKEIPHLKYLIISLQNEKIKDFDEWLKIEKEEFYNFPSIIFDFINCYNQPFINYCHLDVYSYRFRRPLLIYILNTSNYTLMSKYIHTYDKDMLASLTEEQKQKISRYLTISNQINQILFKSKICKDIVQYHLNKLINPKIEDMYNYVNFDDNNDYWEDHFDWSDGE
jgi:hypothetical protein